MLCAGTYQRINGRNRFLFDKEKCCNWARSEDSMNRQPKRAQELSIRSIFHPVENTGFSEPTSLIKIKSRLRPSSRLSPASYTRTGIASICLERFCDLMMQILFTHDFFAFYGALDAVDGCQCWHRLAVCESVVSHDRHTTVYSPKSCGLQPKDVQIGGMLRFSLDLPAYVCARARARMVESIELWQSCIAQKHGFWPGPGLARKTTPRPTMLIGLDRHGRIIYTL